MTPFIRLSTPPPKSADNFHRGHSSLRRGRVSLPGYVYLITATTRDRRRVFADFRLAAVAARSFGDNGLLGDNSLLAWVLMPDHAHWLLRLGVRTDLAGSVARIKSGIARRVNAAGNLEGSLWSRAFHDHAMRREEDIERTAKYITHNPVRAGLVTDVGEYPFWNSVWV